MTRISWIIGLALLFRLPLSSQPPSRPFFGNLHSHTAYSDGTGTPADAYAHARLKGKLDFLLISEHNHAAAEGTGIDPAHLHIAKDHLLYNGPGLNSLISTAQRVNRQFPRRFVALYGQEFSSIANGNHIGVFDVGEVIDEHLVPNKEFGKLYDAWLVVHPDSFQHAAIVQFNHPKSVDEDYGVLKYRDRASFVAAVSPHARTIALLSGPHDTKPNDPLRRDDSLKLAAYFHYLNLGLFLAPTADQDNHFVTFGTSTDHRTAIWATDLTKEALLDAIRENHVYASQDKNLVVDFTVNGQRMGSKIEAQPGTPLTIKVRVQDPDEPTAHYHISLRHDTVGGAVEAATEVKRLERDGNGEVTFPGRTYVGGIEYYLVQVVQTGTGVPDQAWTAPVWIGTPETELDHELVITTATVRSEAEGSLVWSTESSVYHLPGCREGARISGANRVTGNTPPPGKVLHASCPVP